MKYTLVILFNLLCFLGIAQTPFHVVVISDNSADGETFFEEQLRQEIGALMNTRYDFSIEILYSDNDVQKINDYLDAAYADSKTKAVVGVGLLTGNQFSQRDDYPKPTIAGIVLDHTIQNIPITDAGTSGIPNFTYIESPFDIKRDFETLYEIYPYTKVALIGSSADNQNISYFGDFWQQQINAPYVFTPAEGGAQATLDRIPDDVDAVYLLPIFDFYTEDEIRKLLNGLADKKLPSFALFDEPALKLGVYAAYITKDNLLKMPRRIAINISKIADGQNASELPVTMSNFSDNLVINMKTANRTGIYPNFDLISKATLINVNEVDTDRKLTLKSAIAEGLENNLELKIAQKQTQISEKDVAIARSNYLPQIDASTAAVFLDETTTALGMGFQGRFNWSATGSASQLILSEPALANIAIQKLFLESQQQSQRQTELDIVQNVANAYLGILQAQEFVKLQNQNVAVTRKNYDIAKAKERVGYGGNTDVFRWESQMAISNSNLNTALAQLQQARFNLNMLLNRSIKEDFDLERTKMNDELIFVLNEQFAQLINNPGNIDQFADFMVEEAFANLPELRQIEAALQSQERLLKSNKRAFYTPTVALSGQYDYPIYNKGRPEGVPDLGLANPTWNAAVALQIPILQGGSRSHQKQQTQVSVLQLEDQIADLRNKLEFQIRANLETLGASFANLRLTQEAAEASDKNFKIVQDSYQQGLINVTALIDAQNNTLQSDINAINAAYQFIVDFLAVERSIGQYQFLALPEEREAFMQRFVTFMGK